MSTCVPVTDARKRELLKTHCKKQIIIIIMSGNNDTNNNNKKGKKKWDNKKTSRTTSSTRTASGPAELKDYIIDSSKPGHAGMHEESMREIAKLIGRK